MISPEDLSAEELARSEMQKGQLQLVSDPMGALEHLRRAEKLDPRNLDVLILLGKVQMKAGFVVDAVNTLERLRWFDSENVEALAMLSFGLCQLGRFDVAQERAAEVLKIDSKNRTAREVMADCYVAGKDHHACLRELNFLTEKINDDDLARIGLKAGHCYFHLGFYSKALEIASTLKENGYQGDRIENLYRETRKRVRGDIEARLDHMGWFHKFLSRFADKALMDLHLNTNKSMDSLRCKYEIEENMERRFCMIELHKIGSINAKRRKESSGSI